MKKKCIIIGSNSYIGKHLEKQLIENNFEYSAFSFSNNKYKKIDIVNDITNLNKINWNVDFVFIMSGLTGTQSSFDNAKGFVELNEIGLYNILNSIKNTNFRPRIIYPSSRLVYKGKNESINENDELEFKTVYALTKIQAENILKLYQKTFNIPYCIFRICVSYGNVIDTTFSYGTVGFFVNQAIKEKKITLYGSGETVRTYTHIQDICNQILKSCNIDESENNIYNIKGENLSLNQVAEIIACKFNARIEHETWPNFESQIETGNTFFDSSKIDLLLDNYNLENNFKTWISTI